MTPLEHALYYAKRGWRVAPIRPGTKHPRIDRWQDKATTDEAIIRTWWSRFPTDGVSIVTGERSQLVVVDVDPAHGGDETLADLEHEHGALPETVEALTGGGGRHLYFRMPDGVPYPRNDQAGIALGPGLDIRGDGGQVVAPPTVHPNGQPYSWEAEGDPFEGTAPATAPDWLVALLEPKPVAPRRERIAPTATRIGDPAPGEIWADEHCWADVLGADGWQLHSQRAGADGHAYELWVRPGKELRAGPSASLYYGGYDLLKVFTTNPPAGLETGQTYSLWGYHVATRHGADFEAAARTVRHELNARDASGSAPLNEAAATGNDTPAPMPAASRPGIVHNGRQLDDVTREATAALALANQPPHLFVRAGELARVRDDEEHRPIVEQLATKHLRKHLADAATWWRALKDGGTTATAPPLDVVDNILAAGAWPMPPLAGVVELPVVRPDGTFATDHGYDRSTRLYHWHRGADYKPVPAAPTPAELTAAVATITDVLADFPWDTTADRANAWALLLTPLVRPIVHQVPMALVDAPEPGTGKGLLVTVAATLALGRPAGLTAWPSSEEEIAKVITATLMAGSTMVIFDNVEGMIRSGNLAAALTADVWSGRILGLSKNATVPNRATWVATGNNIDVGGDLARRCYRIRLDARQAQPWKRTGFRHPDLAPYVLEHRTELLHALCTVVRSWWVAGRHQAGSIAAMGTYTSWVRTVGGILEHAGVGGFLDNLAAFHASADREAQAWEAFLTAWSTDVGETPMSVAELVARMKDMYGGHHLRDVLPDDLAGHFDNGQFSKRLGMALRKRTGRHYGDAGLHLVEMPRDRRQVAIYAVTTRSVRLFEDDEPRGTLTADAQVPRALPLEDVVERGTAGPDPLTSRASFYPQNGESAGSVGRSGPASPAVPRGGQLTPEEAEFWGDL